MLTSTTATDDDSTTIADWEQIPCVQYGFPDGEGPTRAPKLRTIFEQISDTAETASPIYLLTQDQYQRQRRLETGYEVTGTTSIATELQDEAEASSRVLHPIHVESDVYHKEGPATLVEWFREFVEGYLGVPFDTCTLYFSGNRSIHVHVPRFVAGEDQRERLRELAETFCAEKGAELDCGLYHAKRMFRLPGVKHAETGLRKVEIEPEWDETRIFREANETNPDVPLSYEVVLRRVFATQPSLTVESPQTTLDPPYDLFRVLDSEKTVLELETDERDIETPLIEREQCPDEVAAVPRWAQYNAKEFSPYAFAEDNARSVAAVRLKDGAFCRSDRRGGATMIPAWFYGAVGANGEFTKDQEHAPLQLSKRDYKTWSFQPNDTVVIIGGQSRSSKILALLNRPT